MGGWYPDQIPEHLEEVLDNWDEKKQGSRPKVGPMPCVCVIVFPRRLPVGMCVARTES